MLIIAACFLAGSNETAPKTPAVSEAITSLSTKEQALTVLQTKCNGCHASRNRRMIFTWENMDDLSQKINQQVFIKMRMPKGNATTLSEAERAMLQTWIESLP